MTVTVTAPDRVPVDDDNPWPGLDSYTETEQAYFKGREPQIAELVERIGRERLTVLFGVSGLGKTSLLRAGVFPELHTVDDLPVHVRLSYAESAPPLRAQIQKAVVAAAKDAHVQPPEIRESDTLWETFHRRDADFWNDRNRLVTPVIVLDQFEEAFSLGRGRAATEAILDEIADLVEGRIPPSVKERLDRDPDGVRAFDVTTHRYRVIISLREDFLSELEGLRARMPSIARNRMRLRPMDGEAALLVVDQTKGRLIDSELAKRVVRTVAGRKDDPNVPLEDLQVEPAILSLFCRELNLRRGKEPRITATMLDTAETEILAGYYERCMAKVAPAVRVYVEDELLTGLGFRESRSYADALTKPGVTAVDLQRLIDDRLLRLDTRGDRAVIELTHDVLTKVARASRDLRAAATKAEKERAKLRTDLEAARARAQQVRLRLGLLVLLFFVPLLAGAAMYAYHAATVATQQREEADRQRTRAEEQRVKAEEGMKAAKKAQGEAVTAQGNAEKARLEAEAAMKQAVAAKTEADEQRRKTEEALVAAKQSYDAALKAIEGLKGLKVSGEAAKNVQAVRATVESNLANAQRSPDDRKPDTKRRVYIQIQRNAQQPLADQLTTALQESGFVVPKAETLSTGPSTVSEVRYFRPEDAETAKVVGSILRTFTRDLVVIRFVKGSSGVPPNQYEVWLAQSEGAATQATELHRTVESLLEDSARTCNPDAAKGMNAVFQYELSGDDGGRYHVVVKDGACQFRRGPHASPNVIISMAPTDFVDWFTGKLNGQMAFMSGKLKVSGDMGLLMKAQSLFERRHAGETSDQ